MRCQKVPLPLCGAGDAACGQRCVELRSWLRSTVARCCRTSHYQFMSTLMPRALRLIRSTGRAVLDLLLPPLCLKCRAPVSEPQSVCGGCWSELRFLGPPQCSQCGLPFPHALGADVKCAACLTHPPAFERLRSAIAYDDGSRDLILGFKHSDRLEMAPLFARWLNSSCREIVSKADFLVPVPLHWRRLAMRRYNQAAELARELGALSGVPFEASVLLRSKATASQGEMPSARARLKNVARVFTTSGHAGLLLKGKNVVLVDDVLTTGATATACCKALLRAGAASVSIVTLARVVRPLNLPG